MLSSALVAYLNHRIFRITTSISLLLAGLVLSLLVQLAGSVLPAFEFAADTNKVLGFRKTFEPITLPITIWDGLRMVFPLL